MNLIDIKKQVFEKLRHSQHFIVCTGNMFSEIDIFASYNPSRLMCRIRIAQIEDKRVVILYYPPEAKTPFALSCQIKAFINNPIRIIMEFGRANAWSYKDLMVEGPQTPPNQPVRV